MLKKGTKVEIISKSIGNDKINFRKGYIIDVRDGDEAFGVNYGREYYSVSSYKDSIGGDHYLKCDLINLDQTDFFSDKDFEI